MISGSKPIRGVGIISSGYIIGSSIEGYKAAKVNQHTRELFLPNQDHIDQLHYNVFSDILLTLFELAP
jgi:hypothetical protein